MNICLIGDGLTNLVLAKILANKNISISVCFESKKTKKSTSRTLGISKNNFDFFKSSFKKNRCFFVRKTNVYTIFYCF